MATRRIRVAKKPTMAPVIPGEDEWVLQNKKLFPSWINTTFRQYSKPPVNNKNKNKNKSGFVPFPNQLFLRDYMQNTSPYRGVLLYHGLGTGKTCSSIQIAENVKNTKNIIVLLPASLKDNFIQKGLKFCGDTKYQSSPTGNKLIEDTYYFISYNSPTKIRQLDKLGTLDNHLIIIEEMHNLVSMMAGGSKQGREIYQRLMDAKNIKIVGLTGTPLINYPYESSILFNLLRGYMEEIILSFNKIEGSLKLQQLEREIADLEEVDLVEINMSNRTISIYLRNIATWDPQFKPTIQRIIDMAKTQQDVQLRPMKTSLHTLFPEDEDRFLDIFVEKTSRDEERIRNKQIFQRRILGLVSYVAGQTEGYPEVTIHPPVKIPMSDYQFDLWESAREKLERPLERRLIVRGTKATKTTKIPSTFRVYSRQFSNFVFPPEISRPFPRPEITLSMGKLDVKAKNNKTIAQIAREEDVNNYNGSGVNRNEKERKEERREESVKMRGYMERQQKALELLKGDSNKYLTMEALKTYSPKMAEALRLIEGSPGLVLLYSNFRTLEGIGIMQLVLEQAGFKKYMGAGNNGNGKGLRYATYSGQEDMKERAKVLKTFTNENNKMGDIIKVLMISGAGSEGLDLANIRRVIIMEPHWGWVRISQVIGRGARYHSHVNLPLADRKVDVYILLSALTEGQARRAKDKQSTDEYIYDIALKKKAVLDELLEIMRETSVDCVLNANDKKGNVRCFSFGDDVGPKELAYLPNINRDIVYDRQQNTRVAEVKRVYIPALVDERGLIIVPDKQRRNLYYLSDRAQRRPLESRPSKITKVYLSGDDVYNFNSVKSKAPILIGRANNKGQLVSNKN